MPDQTELLARIGADLGFLTPLEPCGWPDRVAGIMAVDDRPPGRWRVVVAVDPEVAEALAVHLGVEPDPVAITGELANVVAGHLLPGLEGHAGGFLPPVALTGLPTDAGVGVGVRFAEGCMGLALIPRP